MPISCITPTFSSAPANAIPPPNIKSIPHAIFDVSLHSSSILILSPSLLPLGMANNARAPIMAIILSSSFINPSPFTRSFVIQKKAVTPNIHKTLFSATDILPSSLSSFFINKLVELLFANRLGNNHFVSTKYIAASKIITMGKLNIIQSRNCMVYPYFFSIYPTKAALGGVPITVAIPPILLA